MRKVNLLFVITKLELGGAQKQLLSLIRRLDKQKYSLFLFTARDGLLIDDALSIKELKTVRSRFLERPVNPLKDFLALCQIYGFIKKNRIEVVHTHSSKAGILGRWAGSLARNKIIVHTVHGWSFNDYQSPFWRRVIIWLERLTALVTDKLIAVSYYDLQKGLDNRIGDKDKYELIRYGISHREFTEKPEGLREKLKLGANDLLIGMIACFKPQKSPQDFIRLAFLINKSPSRINASEDSNSQQSAKISNKVKFILVGDGVLRKKVEGLISKYNLNEQVILTGWCRDIPGILSAIDVFVLTSLWEGLPISALEAMAASLPVIVTNTGGVAEVISEGKNGFLVLPGDVRAMAEKLSCLIKEKDLRIKIGTSAKNSLGREFSLENMAENTEKLYRNSIERLRLRENAN
ncbi:MAG: glycosyltransferase family 4 protein [Candidatus Omnitrophota bacterium]